MPGRGCLGRGVQGIRIFPGAQGELDRNVVMKQPQAGAVCDRLPDGHLAHGERADNEHKHGRASSSMAGQ